MRVLRMRLAHKRVFQEGKMRIGGWVKFSLIDYPGEMAAVIFTQGCNYRCAYCHNADLVLPEQYTQCIPEAEVLGFLKERQGKLNALVVSGGEPTLQPGLLPFLQKVKALGYFVKLDTNGSRPKVLKALLAAELVDYIAMDIKAPVSKYDFVTGISTNVVAVKESIDLISRSEKPHVFRTTVVRSMLSFNDIRDISRMVPEGSRFILQEFVPRGSTLDPEYANPLSQHYSKEELNRMLDFFRKSEIRVTA